MAAGAMTKAATATLSSAAERSIEVALTDITGLLIVGRLSMMPCMHESEFECFFVPSVNCLFLPELPKIWYATDETSDMSDRKA